MRVLRIVRRVRAILVETNRIGHLHGHSPNLYIDPERTKHLHEFSIKIGHCARNETQASDFASGCHDVELVIDEVELDRKSTRLNSSHLVISYAVFCLKKKNEYHNT